MNDLEDASYSILADEIDVDENNDSDDFDSEDSDVWLSSLRKTSFNYRPCCPYLTERMLS